MLLLKTTALMILFVLTNVKCQTFTDIPPEDYTTRSSLDDCVDRFYTNKSYVFFTSVHNGDPVQPGEYSAFAAIGWTRSSSKIDYFCGGTLITLNYVLTAAHCVVDGEQQPPDTVRLGDVDLFHSEGDENAQQIAIKRFLKHPDFRAARAYHDIALIELEQAVKPGMFVCSACLWTGLDLNFDSLTVMGFGSTNFSSGSSPVLLKAELAPLGAVECTDRFPKHRKIADGILESQFCAAAPNQDACPGDSGGPILVDLVDPFGAKKKIPFVAGIISIGTGCSAGSMGLYTRVASYIYWIQKETGASFDPKQCARDTECVSHYKDIQSSVQYPLVAPDFRVDLMNDESDVAICGGALIDYRHVITSADCVSGPNKPTFVLLGTDRANISDITLHPESQREQNNLAVVTLEQFINFETTRKFAGPACLWKKDFIPEKKVFVSAIRPDDRKQLVVNATITQDDLCKEGLICAMNRENLIPDTCTYGLGGPVTNYHSKIKVYIPFLYGVNTEGSSCGGRGNRFKAVATAQHYTWIESVVLKHIIEALDLQVPSSQHEYFVDNPCLPATGGGLGRCVPAEGCQRLMKEHRQGLAKIKTCAFEGHQPIVCCPNSYL
ncbi:ovochymase-2-like [Ochlerotatus camptorhynchus]|uniref:ovochymase-2-like n=1 Tax=Ochlerotatus camptorhynchus TaxID=644619 RepID=UPI0031D33811